jgi:hypothetical protein
VYIFILPSCKVYTFLQQETIGRGIFRNNLARFLATL